MNNSLKFDFIAEPSSDLYNLELDAGEKISLKGSIEENFIDTLEKRLDYSTRILFDKDYKECLKNFEIQNLFAKPASGSPPFFSLLEDKIKICCTPIHGDLNLTNILMSGTDKKVVDMDPGAIDYWLVDFAKSEEKGHTAFDFVKIEINIKLNILSEILFDIAKATSWERKKADNNSSLENVLEAYRIFEKLLTFNTLLPDKKQKNAEYDFLLSLIEDEKN